MKIPDFKKQGRPRVYDFENMEVGKVYHIPLRKGQKDIKLESARSLCSANSKDGKKFRATADETGVYILREA